MTAEDDVSNLCNDVRNQILENKKYYLETISEYQEKVARLNKRLELIERIEKSRM